MPDEENPQPPLDAENQQTPAEVPAAAESQLPAPEEDIDLNTVFPDEETDLNELFPELEMKHLLQKAQKNKKDLDAMRDRFSDGI